MSEQGDKLRKIRTDLITAGQELAAAIGSATEGMKAIADALDTPPAPVGSPILRSTMWYTPDLPPEWHQYDAFALQRSATDHQGTLPTSKLALSFTTPLARRFGDVNGFSVALPPDQVKFEWLYRDSLNKPFTRIHAGREETFINPGNLDYIKAVLNWLPQKLDGFDGVLIDEVDMFPDWSFPSSRGFVTPQAHRANQLTFLRALKTRLAVDGLELWVNLGGNNVLNDPWLNDVLNLVDGVWFEQFIGRYLSGYTEPATVGDMWLEQTGFLAYANERCRTMANVAHGSQVVIDYAFLSWLLVKNQDSFFGAQPGGNGANRSVTPALLEMAGKLGPAIGPAILVPSGNGTYTRAFQGGSVLVLPTRAGWQNGRVQLNA